MKSNSICSIIAVLAVMVLVFGFAPQAMAEEGSDHAIHVKRVHKVVLDCDEDSGEDCERQVHVKVMRGDGGHHYSIHAGKGGFLGIQLTDLTPELRIHFGVAEDEGVMVAKTVDDSAAFRAGLAAGDIITSVDGETVSSSRDLTQAIRSREEGESVSLEVWRDGSFTTIAATLDEYEMPHRTHRAVFIDCDDEEGDCDFDISGYTGHDIDFDCPEGEPCEVDISCAGGDCECTVNGESIDCPEFHGLHHSEPGLVEADLRVDAPVRLRVFSLERTGAFISWGRIPPQSAHSRAQNQKVRDSGFARDSARPRCI